MSSQKTGNSIKLVIGLAISIGFLYLAFGNFDWEQMKTSFRSANYWLFIPAALATFISHWLRAIRLQMFIKSIKWVSVYTLFKATLIGYMGNTVLPAHLGEVFRANVIGYKEGIPTSSVLATLVMERIIDLLSLLVIMLVAVFIYPFPDWVTKSGYIMFVFVCGLFLVLILLKRQHPLTIKLIDTGLKILPSKLAVKVEELIGAFIKGINGLARKRDYLVMFILSIAIWAGYWLTLHILFYAFGYVGTYDVGVIESIVLLVVTTISIVVPSSPGYVGTYHYLCQLTLALFKIPGSVGLPFSFIAHGLSVIPTAIVGFFFAWREGLSRVSKKRDSENQGR